ncbi:MAG: thymidylate synthase [Candidatus Altiarchaeota archaeon]
MSYYIRGKTIAETWNRLLNVIWYSGEDIKSQRGKTKEMLNLMCEVANPADRSIKGFPMGEEELKAYAKQLLSKDRSGFEYTYGERLRAWGSDILDKPVDQLDAIAKTLKRSRGTRRATAVTWIPPIDSKKEEVPCLILADFKVRDGKLNLTAVFRSNDMYGAWPANMYGLNKVNNFVAKKVGVKAGAITTLSISAHVYEHDYGNVKKALRIQ